MKSRKLNRKTAKISITTTRLMPKTPLVKTQRSFLCNWRPVGTMCCCLSEGGYKQERPTTPQDFTLRYEPVTHFNGCKNGLGGVGGGGTAHTFLSFIVYCVYADLN
ncbi:hypothetical protein XENORESO_017197 [Xenotaenia resolanae]|uniref:Uncharacterized protein n=1 Tax=Xenotaenia resolanae TaxID=208358 RepID=A0ABV0WWA1_9TELE